MTVERIEREGCSEEHEKYGASWPVDENRKTKYNRLKVEVLTKNGKPSLLNTQ